MKLITFIKNKIHKKQNIGIDNLFFEVGGKYLVKESFLCEKYDFIKGDILKCTYNYYAWYDGIYIISFLNKNAKESRLIIRDWYFDENKKTHIKTTNEEKKELQTYEKYFDRLS